MAAHLPSRERRSAGGNPADRSGGISSERRGAAGEARREPPHVYAVAEQAYPYISPVSPLYLPYISP